MGAAPWGREQVLEMARVHWDRTGSPAVRSARCGRRVWGAEAEPKSLRGRRRRKEKQSGGGDMWNSRSCRKHIWSWRQKQRSGIKKWGHRFVEENELAREWERGSSSKGPRAGEPQGEAQRGWRRQQIKKKADARKWNQVLENLENINRSDGMYVCMI